MYGFRILVESHAVWRYVVFGLSGNRDPSGVALAHFALQSVVNPSLGVRSAAANPGGGVTPMWIRRSQKDQLRWNSHYFGPNTLVEQRLPGTRICGRALMSVLHYVLFVWNSQSPVFSI